ncbi:hypothetical protein PUN28_003384 [Cardiocondyla obscurior]|uniref:Uncharacterized protein n=1 Tax=Cardiocondyla obscurior TaxID=286306 RepID=A0AAW2GNA5_9HYME
MRRRQKGRMEVAKARENGSAVYETARRTEATFNWTTSRRRRDIRDGKIPGAEKSRLSGSLEDEKKKKRTRKVEDVEIDHCLPSRVTPRAMRNYTYTRMHRRRVICTKAESPSASLLSVTHSNVYVISVGRQRRRRRRRCRYRYARFHCP